ncbi:MAG TPA: DNA alkylation repair protein [Fimbriimonadaceae bacterium]|nr:DNA alkylation repair protein [Fimbriimonadaceae bacterium]
MTAQQILDEIEPLGTEGYRRVMRNHGVTGPLFGVKVGDLKKYEKAIKKNHNLALELYDTGIYDAMYLAGLIADETKMSKDHLRDWLTKAQDAVLAEFAVAWVASEGPHGWDLAMEWIDADDEKSQIVGWGTLSSVLSVKKDSELDIPALRGLLKRVSETIHDRPDRVRYKMNGFVIALGCFVAELKDEALLAAESIGRVKVDMGKTACEVPFAPDYIRKVESMGRIGKKRKSARC